MNYPLLYLEHLSQGDLELLAQIAGTDAEAIRQRMLQRPEVIRVAIDQEHVGHDAPIAGAREIALFPPMTGG